MREELKKTNHISYKEYQKKVTKNPNEGIAIFVSAFFILLLLFLGIAKQISPEIDVSIGGDNSKASQTEVEKSVIDERLKSLQMEDDGENVFSPELDEKVVIPEKKVNEEPKEEVVAKQPEKEVAAPSQPAAPVLSKVVVGYYATKEQAEVAKGIIAEAGLNITPFVRNIGGAYTIQVGIYSTREKAQNVVNDLLRNNYPARIITE